MSTERTDLKTALDAERANRESLEACVDRDVKKIKDLQTQLSQLQALVRDFIEAWDHDGEPNAVAYEGVVERARATLDATTPATKGGDGE